MYISLHCALCAEWVYTLAAFFKVWNRHTRGKYARWRFTLSTRTFSAFWKFHLATRKTVTKDSNETDFGLVGGGRQDAPNFLRRLPRAGLLPSRRSNILLRNNLSSTEIACLPSTRQAYYKYTSNAHSESKRRAVRLWCVCKSIFSTRKSFRSLHSIASH